MATSKFDESRARSLLSDVDEHLIEARRMTDDLLALARAVFQEGAFLAEHVTDDLAASFGETREKFVERQRVYWEGETGSLLRRYADVITYLRCAESDLEDVRSMLYPITAKAADAGASTPLQDAAE